MKHLALEEVAAEHRAAIEAFARTAESVDQAAWNLPRAEGK